jgi:hypothetical protein
MADQSVDPLAAYLNQLGRVPDEEIAAKAGMSRNSVGAYRRKHGIPAYTGYLFAPTSGSSGKSKTRRVTGPNERRRGRVSKLEPYVHLLGVKTDAEVAAIAGVARASVTMYRNRYGIPASRQVVAPPVVSEPGSAAFGLVARSPERRLEFVVFGADVSDAVGRAEVALSARGDGPWRIDDLRWLGDALTS